MADAPWTERNCSISIFSNSRCGFSNYFPSEHNLITISSCNININSHLQSLQLSKTCIPSEGHLIFFRLGIFTLFCDYTICPHHRATLGIRWRRSVACSHPNHKGKTKPDRGVTPIVSRHLLISTGQLVPVGSGICQTCRGGIPNLDSMSFEDNDVHHKEQPFGGFEQVSTSASSAKEEFDPEQSKTVNTIQNRKRIKLEDTSIETHTCKTAESLSDDESFLDSQSQSLSQISSWSQENMETSLSDLNKGIDIISRGHSSPVKFQVRSDISSLKPSTKKTVKRKVVSAIDTVLNGIAPGQSQALFKMIQDKDPESANSSELQEIIVKIHQESTDRNTKQQLLSLIALSHTKKDLQQLIPGLTVYAINDARKHAKTNGHGAIIPKQLPVFRHRMDKDKLDHALDFFFSPSFHQVSSFGVKEMKLDNGNTVTIPEVVRTACHATLINVYTKFCTETEFLPLSRSTLFKILNACPSSRRTNLKGLDNCAADGGASYETLLTTVKEMGNYVVDEEVQVELRDCKDSLNASKIYLKTDFKAHLRKCDKCPDHCINYSLSDPTDQHLQQHCVDHQHDMVCERCNLLPQAVSTSKDVFLN